MARFARLKVLNKMMETGMVPVFYNADIEVARKVAAAVFAGGCPLLEFTNRGDLTPGKSSQNWNAIAPGKRRFLRLWFGHSAGLCSGPQASASMPRTISTASRTS